MADYFSIPEELRIEILSCLDAVSLVRCAMTCKTIYQTVKAAPELLYTIQLHLDGVEDTRSTADLGYHERINRLLRRRQMWLLLNWLQDFSSRIKGHELQYDLEGGVLATTNMRDSHRMLKIRYPATADNATERNAERELSDWIFDGFTMDLSQDLFLFSKEGYRWHPDGNHDKIIYLHIDSLSKNGIHPLAHQSPLEVVVTVNEINNTPYSCWPTPSVADDIVTLYYTTTSPPGQGPGSLIENSRLMIWNWKKSDLLFDSSVSFDPPLPTTRFGYALLSPDFFLISTQEGAGSIRLFRLARPGETSSPAICLATFGLPPLVPGAEMVRITSEAGPIESRTRPLPRVPLIVNDVDRLHMFELQYQYDRYNKSVFNMFVHQRVFMKYARSSNGPRDAVREIPWEEWGPSNTRFMHKVHVRAQRSRYIHGQRVVCLAAMIRSNWYDDFFAHSLVMLDFSLAAVLAAKNILPFSMPAAGGNSEIAGKLLPSCKIHKKMVFQRDVETYLPCVSTKRNLTEVYTGYLIHADGIIGVKANQDDNSVYRLDVFRPTYYD